MKLMFSVKVKTKRTHYELLAKSEDTLRFFSRSNFAVDEMNLVVTQTQVRTCAAKHAW